MAKKKEAEEKSAKEESVDVKMVKHTLTEEDFDNNPDFAKQGLNVGDEIEIPAEEGEEGDEGLKDNIRLEEFEVELDNNNDVRIPIEKTALAHDEEIRLVITQKKDGTLLIHTKVADGVMLTPSNLIGLIEVSKFDILDQQTQRRSQQQTGGMPPNMKPEDLELVNFIPNEEDLKVFPELAQTGMEVGKPASLPKFVFNKLRDGRENPMDGVLAADQNTEEDCGCDDKDKPNMEIVE